MKAPAHIAGSLAFTGLFCSLFNVNIFERWQNVIVLIFFALLPDIDHTKSIIGKLFYPLAKWLSVRFGHRTVTHSIFFAILATSLLKIVSFYFGFSADYYLIAWFSIGSHFILDMITIEGIPLFYPFAKNPCVMPANQQFRFRTNDNRSEAIVFFICTLCVFSMQDLFAKGFWTSYNESFNTLQHIKREYKRSADYLILDCHYTNFGDEIKKKNLLLSLQGNDYYLLDENKKLSILNETKQGIVLHKIMFFHSDSLVSKSMLVLDNVSLDSLNKIAKDKFCLTVSVLANKPITILENVQEYHKTNNTHFLHNAYNFSAYAQKYENQEKIKYNETLLKINAERRNIAQNKAQNQNLIYIRDSIENTVKLFSDAYQINHAKNQIIALNKKINNSKAPSTEKLNLLLQQLQTIDTTQNALKISANIEYLNIPEVSILK